jgi:centromeric protein E
MQGTKTSPGVIPLAIEEVFLVIERTVAREFLLRVSYLEIYNEHIIDLLSPATNTTQIKIFDDRKKGVNRSMVKCVPASFWVAFLTSALKCLQVLWCLV